MKSSTRPGGEKSRTFKQHEAAWWTTVKMTELGGGGEGGIRGGEGAI